MSIKIEDVNYPPEKMKQLSNKNSGFCILPDNFEETENVSEFHYSSSLETFIKLAKQSDLSVEIIGEKEDYKLIENRAMEWFGPVIFISSLYYSNNPDAVSVALSMIASYLTKLFKVKKNTDVNLTIIVNEEKSKKTKKIQYKGDVSGLKEVENIVKRTFNSSGDSD